MLQKTAMKIVVIIVLVSIPVGFVGTWYWTFDRNWPFVIAAKDGNISKVRAGLDSGIDPNQAKWEGVTALRFAMISHRREAGDIVRLLLDRGADPNDGLYLAVVSRQPDMVKLLIARGADVNPKVCCGEGSLLLVAAQTKNNKIIQLLKTAGARK